MTRAACGFGISVNFNAVLRFFIIFCAVLRFWTFLTPPSRVMRAPLQVLVVLLYSAYRACACTLLFKAHHPIPPLLLYFLLAYYLLSKFSTVLPVQCAGGWGRVFLAGRARGWVASRTGSWVFWLFGFGVSTSSFPCSWAPNLHMRQRR